MPHFFINTDQITDKNIIISRSSLPHQQNEENYFHIARSLRARIGEKLLFIDPHQIQYETTITEITDSKIVAQIDKSYLSKRYLDFDLYLAQSPLRSDAQNLLIEKATELGVKGIFPIKTDNCVLNLEMINKKIPKWNKIMYEASKQCERAEVPICFDCTTIETLMGDVFFDKIYIFCERIASKTIRTTFENNPIKKKDKVLVIIGPEGGFSQKEFEYFNKLTKENTATTEMLTLGNLILKADTAVIVALGNIIYEYSNS